MSEISYSYMPHARIRSNAFWTGFHIDNMQWPPKSAKAHYIAHINDCIDNPTIGFIARSHYLTGRPINYPECAKRNKLIFDVQPEIVELNNALRDKVNTLYPKTQYARAYIIDDKRILLDYVKKGKRYTKIDRAIILLKKIFHRV